VLDAARIKHKAKPVFPRPNYFTFWWKKHWDITLWMAFVIDPASIKHNWRIPNNSDFVKKRS